MYVSNVREHKWSKNCYKWINVFQKIIVCICFRSCAGSPNLTRRYTTCLYRRLKMKDMMWRNSTKHHSLILHRRVKMPQPTPKGFGGLSPFSGSDLNIKCVKITEIKVQFVISTSLVWLYLPFDLCKLCNFQCVLDYQWEVWMGIFNSPWVIVIIFYFYFYF